MALKVDILLPNTTQYGVLDHFARKLFEAFQRLGFSARLLSKEQYSHSLFNDPPHFTVGINGAPQDEFGEFLCDTALVPHLACLVDPPFRFINLQASPYILITSDDQACIDLFKTAQHPNYFFFPHGVEPELLLAPSLPRIYDIVFLGTWIDSNRLRANWKKRFPLAIRQTMEESAEEALFNPDTHFIQCFLTLINTKAKTVQLPSFSLAEVLQEVELYLKARDREILVSSITSSRIDVFGHLLGGGSLEDVFASQSHVVTHSAVHYLDALHIMKQSKIILNSGIKSTYGAHERIFSGLAAGAAVLTSNNRYMREHFCDGQSILLYEHQEMQAVDGKLCYFLNHPKEREALVEKGRSLVKTSHTWDKRLEVLLPKILPLIKSLSPSTNN